MSLHDTHPNLLSYVERMNVRRRLFGDKPIRLPFFTVADRKAIKDQLACDLSPENLTCDGELEGKALASRVLFLESVERELENFA